MGALWPLLNFAIVFAALVTSWQSFDLEDQLARVIIRTSGVVASRANPDLNHGDLGRSTPPCAVDTPRCRSRYTAWKRGHKCDDQIKATVRLFGAFGRLVLAVEISNQSTHNCKATHVALTCPWLVKGGGSRSPWTCDGHLYLTHSDTGASGGMWGMPMNGDAILVDFPEDLCWVSIAPDQSRAFIYTLNWTTNSRYLDAAAANLAIKKTTNCVAAPDHELEVILDLRSAYDSRCPGGVWIRPTRSCAVFHGSLARIVWPSRCKVRPGSRVFVDAPEQ